MMNIPTGFGPRPAGSGFESIAWYFMRVSAIGLFFLAIIHLLLNHVVHDVSCTSYDLVALRYANPYWRVYDWLLLSLALLHGMNGLRIIVADYVRDRTWQVRITWLLVILTVVFFMIGTVTLIEFQPVTSNLGPHCLK